MGAITTADERLQEARDHIRSAAEALSEIVVQRCWGTEEYAEQALDRFQEVFISLMELRRKI